MRIRLVALIPGLALAGLVGGGVGLGLGIRFHGGLAGALPGRLGAYLAPNQSSLNNPPSATRAPSNDTPITLEDTVIYQCGMHNPPYEQGTPGNCPICGMPLQAVHVHRGAGGASGVGGITIDPAMVQNMGVRTAMPMVGKLQETVRAVGTLTEPEESHREINLRVNGWIEKLYANQEGMEVHPGTPLFDLYSPEITGAADEVIAARRNLDTARGMLSGLSNRGSQGESVNRAAEHGTPDDFLVRASQSALSAARRKLGLMGLTEAQVAGIEKLDKAPLTVAIVSPMHGHISAKRVIEGGAVKAGDELMEISDLSTMWLIVQVFEQELGGVHVGQKVTATVDAAPGKVFEGTVDFVYPHLDTGTRTAQVRVVIPNADHSLHQNMYAEARIEEGGGAMPAVLVPREAVLDTGERQVVFVALGGGHFAARDVQVGRTGSLSAADATRYVEVLSGVTANDTVVTSGQFLLDSESRLEEARKKFATPAADGTPAKPVTPGMEGMPGM